MPLKKHYNLKSSWTLGKKGDCKGMKAFYLINYTDS